MAEMEVPKIVENKIFYVSHASKLAGEVLKAWPSSPHSFSAPGRDDLFQQK